MYICASCPSLSCYVGGMYNIPTNDLSSFSPTFSPHFYSLRHLPYLSYLSYLSYLVQCPMASILSFSLIYVIYKKLSLSDTGEHTTHTSNTNTHTKNKNSCSPLICQYAFSPYLAMDRQTDAGSRSRSSSTLSVKRGPWGAELQ